MWVQLHKFLQASFADPQFFGGFLKFVDRADFVIVRCLGRWTRGHEFLNNDYKVYPTICRISIVFPLETTKLRDFSLLAAQIRAARGLLGWSQAYLAEGCKIHRATLVDLESGKREPHEATLTVLMSELTAAGIVFTDTGVQFRKWPPRAYLPTGIKHKK